MSCKIKETQGHDVIFLLKRRLPKVSYVLKKDNVNFSLYEPYLTIFNELELIYCVRQVNLCDEDMRIMEGVVNYSYLLSFTIEL